MGATHVIGCHDKGKPLPQMPLMANDFLQYTRFKSHGRIINLFEASVSQSLPLLEHRGNSRAVSLEIKKL